MKKALSYLTRSWLILSILVFSSWPAFAIETDTVIPRIEILIPGMTRTIEITQNYKFPRDSSQFLIFIIGYGGVSITLRKVDTEGDTLFLTGVGISSAGIEPVFKFGTTGVTLTAMVRIGQKQSPYGLLWISSWLNSSADDPPYNYSLVLSF